MDPVDTQKMETLLRALWRSNKAVLLERVDLIRAAQRQLVAGVLDAQTHKQAREAAHKLAGVLGTFGLPQGTNLARQVEEMLQQAEGCSAADGVSLAPILDSLEAMIAAKSAEVS